MENSILDQLANKHVTDKGTKYPGHNVHGYAPIYEKYLDKWRLESIRMLEIGICLEFTPGGQSVRMWYDYFSQAEIYTFDIVDMSHLENERIKFFKGDQGNRENFNSMYETFGSKPFEFILEDGSHLHHHQMISLGHLFKYVKSGGYYILEDITEEGVHACCQRNDETYKVIKSFQETGIINTEHITDKEKQYLEKNVSKIEIYPDIQNEYRVAIIHKK